MQQCESTYILNGGCCILVAYLAAGGWYGVVCSAQLRWHFQHSCSTDPGEPRSLWWLRMPDWWPATHWTPWRQSWHPVQPGHWRRPESAGLTFGALRYFFKQAQEKEKKWKLLQTDKLHCGHVFHWDDLQTRHLAWPVMDTGVPEWNSKGSMRWRLVIIFCRASFWNVSRFGLKIKASITLTQKTTED